MSKFILLDIDGVLNSLSEYQEDSTTYLDFCSKFIHKDKEIPNHPLGRLSKEKLSKFKELVNTYDCTIILTSTWAILANLKELPNFKQDFNTLFNKDIIYLQCDYDLGDRLYKSMEYIHAKLKVKNADIICLDDLTFENSSINEKDINAIADMYEQSLLIVPVKGSTGMSEDDFTILEIWLKKD